MSSDMADAVNHPSHYQSGAGIEAIDVIEGFGLGFSLGNAVKYVLRAGKKGDAIEDLRKARWYLDREIDRLAGQQPRALPAASGVEIRAPEDDTAPEDKPEAEPEPEQAEEPEPPRQPAKRPANRPVQSGTRIDQAAQWLRAQGMNPVILPSKNSLAERAGVLKGSLGYIYEGLLDRGIVQRIEETRDGNVAVWLAGPAAPVLTNSPLQDGQKNKHAPAPKLPSEAEKEAWIAEHGVTTEAPEIKRACDFLGSRGRVAYKHPLKGWMLGQKPTTPEAIIAEARAKGFGQEDGVPADATDTAALPPPSTDRPKYAEPARCTQPGCKRAAQPGRDICATCNSALLAMKARERANMVDDRSEG